MNKISFTLIVIFTTCILTNASAQDKITIKDAKEINHKAAETIRGLAGLLSFITTPGITKSELSAAVDSSYMASADKIFYDDKVIFEDDIDPASGLGKTYDIPVERYLNDLDIKYVKLNGGIKFKINSISAVKLKEFLYVRVKFDCQFDSKYKINNSRYMVKEREAIVRLDRSKGNNWNAYIMGVSFYNPENAIDSPENNVPITLDMQTISPDSLAIIIKRDSILRADSLKRNETLSLRCMQSADSLLKINEFSSALTMLEKAKDLVHFLPSLTLKIIDVKKEIARNTYKNYKNEGDDAKSKHKYQEAIQNYRHANKLRAETDISLSTDIDELSKLLAIIDLPMNILQNGTPEDAIKECERVLGLKEYRNSKSNFPELYYIEALAYRKILQNKPGDSRLVEKADENFNQAILAFPNYTDAHIARADFMEKYKYDFAGAITDYDALTSIALDDSPEMPVYYARKAKLKDKSGNVTGAIDDYSKSIALNPKADSFYVDRGELLYRLNKFENAQKDLDSAILLNDKNKYAFFYRGLNYIQLKNNFKAGKDFVEAEKLGLEQKKSEMIDSISSAYFSGGLDLEDKKDYAEADTAFDNALKIRNCNALALHGKAEIRFIAGEKLFEKNDMTKAIASYRESIEFNNRAITCKPSLSDAYFKNGLAQNRINERDLAINSFSDAIHADNNNINAFIERGNTLQVLRKYSKATEDYSHALNLLNISYEVSKKENNTTSTKETIESQSKVHQLLGQAQYYSFDFSNSLTNLNKALDLNENNSEALFYKGLIYYAQNDISKSVKEFNMALKTRQDYRYYYYDGLANYKDKNYVNAIDNFNRAIESDTSNLIKNKFYVRGMSYFRNKSLDAALKDFDIYNMSENSKTDTGFYTDYGMMQLFANQDSLAYKTLNHALSLSANNSKTLFVLGCYFAKTGKAEKSWDLFERAFSTKELTEDDIKTEEDAFLVVFNKDKANRNRFSKLKKTYLNN